MEGRAGSGEMEGRAARGGAFRVKVTQREARKLRTARDDHLAGCDAPLDIGLGMDRNISSTHV